MRNELDFIYKRLTKTVIGSEEPAFLMIVGLLSDGHMLIQGAPGIGKPLLLKLWPNQLMGVLVEFNLLLIYYHRIFWDILFTIREKRFLNLFPVQSLVMFC